MNGLFQDILRFWKSWFGGVSAGKTKPPELETLALSSNEPSRRNFSEASSQTVDHHTESTGITVASDRDLDNSAFVSREPENVDSGSAEITHPSILFRISRSFRDGMSADELYEATRGVWRVSASRMRARYAMPVARGRILEVYEIEEWAPAGSTPYRTRTFSANEVAGRWEFVGKPASDAIRRYYIGRNVDDYYPAGAMNPVAYALGPE